MTTFRTRVCVYCGRAIGDYGATKDPKFRKHVRTCPKNPENFKPPQGKKGIDS